MLTLFEDNAMQAVTFLRKFCLIPVLSGLVMLSLGGCGIKGPLYMPSPAPEKTVAAPDTGAAPAQAPAEEETVFSSPDDYNDLFINIYQY